MASPGPWTLQPGPCSLDPGPCSPPPWPRPLQLATQRPRRRRQGRPRRRQEEPRRPARPQTLTTVGCPSLVTVCGRCGERAPPANAPGGARPRGAQARAAAMECAPHAHRSAPEVLWADFVTHAGPTPRHTTSCRGGREVADEAAERGAPAKAKAACVRQRNAIMVAAGSDARTRVFGVGRE